MLKFLTLCLLCGCATADFAMREVQEAMTLEEKMMERPPCELLPR